MPQMQQRRLIHNAESGKGKQPIQIAYFIDKLLAGYNPHV